MLFRGIAAISGMIATAAVGFGYVLTSSASSGPWTGPWAGPSSSLALASAGESLSLGNPAAMPGIETASPDAATSIEIAAAPKWVKLAAAVRKGDTLAKVLVRAGISARDANAAIRAFSKAHDPRRIRKGDELSIIYRPHAIDDGEMRASPGTFLGFGYDSSPEREVVVLRGDDGAFTAETRARPLTRQAVRSEGVIASSLYMAGKKQRLPDAVLAELIRAFSWDVDFQRDIRKNDGFQILYNRISDEDGRATGDGEILFAALTLSGERKAIYRFKGDKGDMEYFDEKGRSAQKALMRTPINGARLSSGYGKRRHPILGFTKMHRGVDFAAPRGTPIFAAGNGTLVFAGRNGGYGNYIRIRHNGDYDTAYAHMNGLARGMRKGRRVTQGQIIGYVGNTGRSTGPHLHYEILRNGKNVNPLRVRMPSGRTLKGAELARFQAQRAATDRRYALMPKSPIETAAR